MATVPAVDTILEARGVGKCYEGKRPILVLDGIDLAIRRGEIVTILGPSDSGKSTLPRILAGLIPPSGGEVLADGELLHGVNPRVAMVFQSFALFPWLTVLENVELGLEPLPVPAAERRRRALEAIDIIGLDGFESAYPKELSGGMRQRVGFARALVVEPEILMMDEPFSALDVLTASNLRDDLFDLWLEKKMPFAAIVMVTHNIDEAVLMADHVVVLGHDPGRIRADFRLQLSRPRDLKSQQAQEVVELIYRLLTHPEQEYTPVVPEVGVAPKEYQTLPHGHIGSLNGLVELLEERGGREDIFELARDLQMEIDDLLPLIQAAELLALARVEQGDIELTDTGKELAQGGIQEDKAIIRRQVLDHVELVRRIAEALRNAPGQRLNWDALHDELQQHFSAAEAERQLDTAIDWGRYAELFAYDEDSGTVFLET